MTEAETTLIAAKYNLLNDIVSSKAHLTWAVEQRAEKLRNLLQDTAQYPKNVPDSDVIVSMPKQSYQEVRDFLLLLERKQYYQLSPFLKECVQEIKIKEDILKTL